MVLKLETNHDGRCWIPVDCRHHAWHVPQWLCRTVSSLLWRGGGGGKGVGGFNPLSSVEVIDTLNLGSTAILGPSMNQTRFRFGACVIGNQIWVLGGYGNDHRNVLNSVEVVQLQEDCEDDIRIQKVRKSLWQVGYLRKLNDSSKWWMCSEVSSPVSLTCEIEDPCSPWFPL